MKNKVFPFRSLFPHGAIIGCLLFILAMTMTVQSQISNTGADISTNGKYLVSMVFIAGAVILAGIWNHLSQVHIGSMICSLGILAAVGSSYQMIFPGSYNTYCLSMAVSAIAAVFFYHYHRRVFHISNALFIVLSVLSIGLMLALIAFGTEENGALLGIKIIGNKMFRPAEFVKILVIYLGAHSYRNKFRQILFCAVSLICCLLCVKCDDLGAAVILFVNFVVLTYLLFDSRVFSTILVVAATVGLLAVLEFTNYGAHAKSRLENVFHAMDVLDGQQRSFLRAVIFGGFSGLGLGNSGLLRNLFAINSDGCLAGVIALYGISIALIVMLAFSVLAITPAFNRSLTPMGYLLLTQMTTYIFCHCFLSLAGSMDIVPFTGLACPVISFGINAHAAFGVLMGLAIGSLHPAPVELKE